MNWTVKLVYPLNLYGLYLSRSKNGGKFNMEKISQPPQEYRSFMSVRELTISGLLAGITIFLGITGYGFIPLIVMNATILHIPTIIGTIVAGPKVGVVVGVLFGLFSFLQTLRAPSLLMQFALQYSVLYDAFICIVPRICIALVV